MFFRFIKCPLFVVLVIPILAAATETIPKLREQKIALSETREVIIAVPDGFALVTGQADGLIAVKLSDEKESVTIDIQFLPDPEVIRIKVVPHFQLLNSYFIVPGNCIQSFLWRNQVDT